MSASSIPNAVISSERNEDFFLKVVELTRLVGSVNIIPTLQPPYEDNSGKWLSLETVIPRDTKDTRAITNMQSGDESRIDIKYTQVPVQKYGNFATIDNELVRMTKDTKFENKIIMGVGELINRKYSRLIVEHALNCETRMSATGGELNKGKDMTSIGLADIEMALQTLISAGARPYSSQINAGPNISTYPIPEAYLAFANEAVISTVRALPGWIPVERYASPTKAIGERGSILGLRFISTTYLEAVNYIPVPALSAYTTYICGQDSMYALEPSTEAVATGDSTWSNDVFSYSLSSRSKSSQTNRREDDPYDLRGFFSIDFYFAAISSFERRSLLLTSLAAA